MAAKAHEEEEEEDDHVEEEEEEEDEEEEEESEGEMRDADRTPVTIVTGFLGAGKSTLINYILKEQTGKRVAVIENEFGSVAIDDELVSANVQAKEDLIVLDNGCVCCTVRGDLLSALSKLSFGNFDAIVIETTGLADPSPVAFTFNDPTVSCNYRIDSILCVADSKNLVGHLVQSKQDGQPNEAVQQVAFADRILLNKTDLVSKEEKLAVLAQIREINAFAEVIECQHGRVDLDRILNVSSFSLETSKELERALEKEKEEEDKEEEEEEAHEAHGHSHCGNSACTHSHGHGHSHGAAAPPAAKRAKTAAAVLPAAVHLSGVSSQGILVEGTLSMKRFGKFIDALLEECGKQNLYRCKGVVSFSSNTRVKSVFHGVHEQINVGVADLAWKPDETRVNKLVFIGKNLPSDIESRVRACLYASAEEEQAEREEEEDA